MATYEENRHVDMIQSTKVTSYEYTLKWIFENFSNYQSMLNSSKGLESDTFYPEPDIWWRVKIKTVYSCLYVEFHKSIEYNDIDLHWKLTFLDKENKILYEINAEVSFKDNAQALINEDAVEEINKTKSSESVIVIIFLKILRPKTTNLSGNQTKAEVSKDAQKSFTAELIKMYDSQVGTDISLKIQDETVGAHKTILSARSPVFAKMFQKETAETRNQVVDIADIKMDTLEKLLYFCYSGEGRDYDWETTLDLYYAADKYEVLKLREMCSLSLTVGLTYDNVIELLQLADRHADHLLKNGALRFLRFYFTRCVQSENWIKFQNEKSKLYEEVIEYIKD